MKELVDRINQILQKEQLSPSEFADSIGIGRPIISHVLSGRNNPSLQLIIKILNTYPAYSSEWLIMGKEPQLPANTNSKESLESRANIEMDPAPAASVQNQDGYQHSGIQQIVENTHNDLPEAIFMMFGDKTYEVYKLRK